MMACRRLYVPDVTITDRVFRHTGPAGSASKPALIDGTSGRTLIDGQLTDGVVRRCRAGSPGGVAANILPRLPHDSVVLNWSERRRWRWWPL